MSKPPEGTTPGVFPNVNHRFGVTAICPCGLTVGTAGGEGCAPAGVGGRVGGSVPKLLWRS